MIPRTTTGWLALVCALLLIATNAYWFYAAVDTGITVAYRDQELGEYRQAFREARLLLPAAQPALTKSELLREAKRISGAEAFEKEGCVWVGSLGFQFDDNERLTHVSPTWNSGEPDPCFPSE